MFPIEVFRVTVMKLVDILRENHIRFHITGGMTSVAYGEPRLTQDVDLVVDNQQLTGKLGDFLSALERTDFYFSPDAVRSAVAERKMFQLLDKAETLKLDVYVRELVPGELDRSVEFEILSGLTLPLVSLPDAAVSKLIWIDRGSHKSRRDLRRLWGAASQGQQLVIEKLSAKVGLTRLLKAVIAEPDEIFE